MKFLKYFLYTVFAITLVLAVIFYSKDTGDDIAIEPMVNVFLNFAYVLAFLAIGVLIVMLVINAVKNKSSLISMAKTLGLAIVLIVVSLLFASGDPVNANVDYEPTVQILKMTDTGLIMCYILFAISIVVIVWGVIRSSLMNRSK